MQNSAEIRIIPQWMIEVTSDHHIDRRSIFSYINLKSPARFFSKSVTTKAGDHSVARRHFNSYGRIFK
jgi:hypothetical protein